MRECVFSLSRNFLFKSRIYNCALVRENTGQRKPVFLHVLCLFVCLFVKTKKQTNVNHLFDNNCKYTIKIIPSANPNGHMPV